MTKEEIKQEKEKCYKQIEEANNRLAEIRKICKHEKTTKGNYSWRIGCVVEDVDICDYCGQVITPLFNLTQTKE